MDSAEVVNMNAPSTANTDVLVVLPKPPQPEERPPSKLLFGAVLMIVGAIGFSPWFVAKMARETPPPAPRPLDTTNPQNWKIDAKWHHSHLFQRDMNRASQFELAWKSQRQLKFQKAIKLYSGLIENTGTGKALNLLERGKCYFELGRFDLAISDFSNSIALNAQDGDAFTWRGKAYEALGQMDKAQADKEQGLRLYR